MLAEIHGESKCTQCLRRCDCYPWELPWWETILHSIPGTGIFTSFIGWGCRIRKINSLEKQSMLHAPTSRDAIRGTHGDSPVSLSPTDEIGATLLGSEDEESEIMAIESDRTVLQEQILTATQRSNAAAIFLINSIGSAIGATIFYTLHRFDRL